MPGFEDSAVIVLLALLLFGPKKLPVLARQFGKLMSDFRRASSEFRTQMEDELRISEQAERQKQIAAAPATTPAVASAATPAIDPTHPQDNRSSEIEDTDAGHYSSRQNSSLDSAFESVPESTPHSAHEYQADSPFDSAPAASPSAPPIATSGEMSILPPSTGLPTPHAASADLSAAAPTQQDAPHAEALHG